MKNEEKRKTTDHTVDGRSLTAKKALVVTDEGNVLFDRIVDSVLSSGFLRWYEAESLSQTNKGSRSVWMNLRETYPDWSNLLRELNSKNCSNRCRACEGIVFLKANRKCCSISKWNEESARRTPDFHGVVDLVMSSGVLSCRDEDRIGDVSATCSKIQKEQCNCRLPDHQDYLRPFIKHDPRYADDYDKGSDFLKCQALTRYTSWMIRNLHSFYNFRKVTDPSRLPHGLGGLYWPTNQMEIMERDFPRRNAFVMNMVSLHSAQRELEGSVPNWYATAFLGERHNPGRSINYKESLRDPISKFCLPPKDEVFADFLRTECYPTTESRTVLGPLVRALSIFAPFMDMVPLDETKRVRLPRSLEKLTEDDIKDMYWDPDPHFERFFGMGIMGLSK